MGALHRVENETTSPSENAKFWRRFLRQGDNFVWGGYRFEVVDMDERNVDKVLVTPLDSNNPNIIRKAK